MRGARTLWELLERRVDATPDGLMFVDEDMRTLTFAEFWSEAERAAAGLRAGGLHPGDVVSWQLPTWIETMVLAAALRRIEVVQNPLSPSLGPQEIEGICAHVGADLLVTPTTLGDSEHEARATQVARNVGGMRVLLVDRALPQGDPTTLAEIADPPDPPDEQVRWLFPTAGATAPPKIACHTDATLLAAAEGMSQRLGLIVHDRHAMVGPAGHISGVVWLMASLVAGCANIVIDDFDPQDSPEVLGREGVTLAGVGPQFHRAYADRQRQMLQPLFPDVRAFSGCGEAKQPDLVDEVRSLFDVPVLSGYGLVEAPVLTMAALTDPDDALVRSEGAPLPGVELRLVGSDGRLVRAGEEGEIRVRAPQMMRGYLDRSDEANSIDADGFFRTGDLGWIDERGELVVTGRIERVTLRDPETISVEDLEELKHLEGLLQDQGEVELRDEFKG